MMSSSCVPMFFLHAYKIYDIEIMPIYICVVYFKPLS